MRRHNRFARLAPAFDLESFHEVVRAEHLACARLEPGLGDRYEGLLDLVFAREDRIALVPFVVVAGMMVLLRESSPFVWPAWLPALRRATVEEIEDAVEPWLRALTMARVDGEERFRIFAPDAGTRATIEAARAAGWLCAAPSDTVLPAVAPYAYAQRFARGKRVAIEDRAGAYGAALLARTAQATRASLGDAELEARARRWFGSDIFGTPAQDGYDIEIAQSPHRGAPVSIALSVAPNARVVEVATPLVPSVTVSFDAEDAPTIGRFSVAAPEPALRPSRAATMPVLGGSSGRIALVLRDDYARVPDADTDAATALAELLRQQGFEANTFGVSAVDGGAWDVVHLFGLRLAPQLGGLATPRGPVVLTPYADDPKDEAAWGSGIVGVTLGLASDVASREHHAWGISERRIAAPTVPAIAAAPWAQDPAARHVLARVAAVYLSCDAEGRRLASDFGCAGGFNRVVPALLGPEPEPASIGGLVGSEPFVLIHAPVEPRCNQLALVSAAAALGLPVVLVGVVRAAAYYSETIQALGPGGCWLPEEQLAPGELAALYASARVFADASWSSAGLYRLARAAGYGCGLVVPASGYARAVWPQLVHEVDPASNASILQGLRHAWDDAARSGPLLASSVSTNLTPLPLLAATLAGYQQIKPHEVAAEH